MTIDWENLIEKAMAVRHNARAPYSDFRVGAALLDDRGVIHAGCNVENVSYGLSVCAERHAVAAAVAAGSTVFRALVVVTDVSPPGSPCGACRQVIMEFNPNAQVYFLNHGRTVEKRAVELLPESFTSACLE